MFSDEKHTHDIFPSLIEENNRVFLFLFMVLTLLITCQFSQKLDYNRVLTTMYYYIYAEEPY